VDLPGYGYTRAPRQAQGGPRGAEGRAQAAREFAELTAAYFGHDDRPARQAARSALLLVDSRHPGLESDLEAWAWLGTVVADRAIAATKVDKLARGERTRAMRTLESVFEHPVLPVSAATGEGLDELWRMIDRLANNPVETASRPRPPKN
jgi:GTP-binding protein